MRKHSFHLTPPAAHHIARIHVGYSGGLDSHALLHMLAHHDAYRQHVHAIHIHHGLQKEADQWAQHCRQVCTALGVPLTVLKATVDSSAGKGIEAAARDARYHAFRQQLDDDDILALAHHADDQAETFLLRALRASSLDGLSSMQAWRRFHHAWLWRPLLANPRTDLEAYAQQHQLQWVEDPSNASLQHDRNYLRQMVMPVLKQRWPHAVDALSKSAALAAADNDSLLQQDRALLATFIRHPLHALPVAELSALSSHQRARLLRLWIQEQGLPPLPAQGVHAVETSMLGASHDTSARFEWSGTTLLRWRDALHAMPMLAALADGWEKEWITSSPLLLPNGVQLQLHSNDGSAYALVARRRRGGERIRLPGREHTHSLKHALQEAHVPPWLRTALPVLYNEKGEVLCFANLLFSTQGEHWRQQQQIRIVLKHSSHPI